MYEMSTGLYTCDFCGVQMRYDKSDDKKGDMWECGKCGSHFCDACFAERHGDERRQFMLRNEKILCPDCYAEEHRLVEDDLRLADGELNDVLIAKTIRRAADLFEDGAILEAEELLCVVDNVLRQYVNDN